MWFWKYRKGREVNRYSIGEKINFYENILEVSNDKKRKKKLKEISIN